MHPVFASRIRFLLYLAAWIPLGAMLGFVLSMAAPINHAESAAITAPITVVLALVCLSPWYSCRVLPLGPTPVWKLLTNHLLAAGVLSGAVLLAARAVAAEFGSVFPGLYDRFQPAMPVLGFMAILLYLLAIALHYALLAVRSSREAEILARESELKALKAQINPHFLFNSLHSISALTTVDAARARDMCIRLSDFLRSSLKLGDRTTIPFREELALARELSGRRAGALRRAAAGCRGHRGGLRRLRRTAPFGPAAGRKRHQARDRDIGGWRGNFHSRAAPAGHPALRDRESVRPGVAFDAPERPRPGQRAQPPGGALRQRGAHWRSKLPRIATAWF